MFKISSHARVYIMCPPHFATGGIELLHQLAYKLNKAGVQALMYYDGKISSDIFSPLYKKYHPIPAHTIEDNEQNLLIIPEVFIDHSLDRYKKIRKVIWWLSIDFFFATVQDRIERKQKKPFFKLKKFIGRYRFPDLNFVRERPFYHLVQSVYAHDYLVNHRIPVQGYLSDYLNSTFLEEVPAAFQKEDIVAYNPKKGFEFTSRLIEANPSINWVALENMTPGEVRDTLAKSKVYIDFGNHPGKDRFPREAAMMHCCIITGKRGAASNDSDLPLPEGFKFDEKTVSLQEILMKIDECFRHYEVQSAKFESYRQKIRGEEKIFDQEINRIFSIGDH